MASLNRSQLFIELPLVTFLTRLSLCEKYLSITFVTKKYLTPTAMFREANGTFILKQNIASCVSSFLSEGYEKS